MRGHWLPLVVTAPTAAVCKIIKIENLQLGQLVQQAQLLVVSISQSVRQCGGFVVKMRVRRVTVWKHEKFTIIPRTRLGDRTSGTEIETDY